MLLMVYQEMSISYDEYEILYEGYMISYDECEILYDGYMISYDHQSSLFQAQLNLTLPSPPNPVPVWPQTFYSDRVSNWAGNPHLQRGGFKMKTLIFHGSGSVELSKCDISIWKSCSGLWLVERISWEENLAAGLAQAHPVLHYMSSWDWVGMYFKMVGMDLAQAHPR